MLATAVKQGMNVQTSQLNGFSPLWIPPDSLPMTFASLKDPGITSDYEVQNDEVSNPNRPVSVVEATAMSLNTAYADLWHRVAMNTANGAPQCRRHGQGLRGGRTRQDGAACRTMRTRRVPRSARPRSPWRSRRT